MRLIKLGGSVITCNDTPDRFNYGNTARLAAEILAPADGIVLVHGTGYVGKPYAIEYDFVRDGLISADRAELAAEIRSALRLLNTKVVEVLCAAGIPAVTASPTAYFDSDMDDFRQRSLAEGLLRQIEQYRVPVFFGDLMPLPNGSHQVFSSDRIATILARSLNPQQVIFLTDVPGVFGRNSAGTQEGSLLSELAANSLEDVFPGDCADVSGGMQGKIRAALDIASNTDECVIASGMEAGVLSALLSGGAVDCTRVIAERQSA